MTIYDELRALLRALDAANVEYALVGALAVAVWGAPRATKDIDLLVQPGDLPRAIELAKARGFTLEACRSRSTTAPRFGRHPKPRGHRPVRTAMTREAIDARLREASRLAGALRPEDRLATKIDLSGKAVAGRLKEASDLLLLCRTLARGKVAVVSSVDFRDDAAILRRFGFEPDPVIEAYKKDVDRTLLRENLRRSPEERCRNFLAAYRLAEELRRAGAASRGR